MTATQPQRRAGARSRVHRALGRSVRALRDLHNEQVYAWECYFRSSPAPPPGTKDPAASRHGGPGVPGLVERGRR